jgi:branched-chain amino acid transport system ATP-binding protein
MAEAAARAVADPAALLDVRDLHGWYDESHVLHGMSFDVSAGEVVTPARPRR